jgi:COMPASS component SWD3
MGLCISGELVRLVHLIVLMGRDPYSGEHRRSIRSHETGRSLADRECVADGVGINDIAISPDSLYLATASDDNTILIHPLSSSIHGAGASTDPDAPADLADTPYLRKLDSHTAPVLSLAFSPKANLLVSGSFDESAIVWDVRRGTPLRVLPAHADPVWTVGFSSEGGMVVTGSADGLM